MEKKYTGQNKLFILISTLDKRILNLKNIIFAQNPHIVYVISHQVNDTIEDNCKRYIESLQQRDDIIYSRLEGKGVAKNRNNTLKFIEKDSLSLVLDDDVLLCENSFENVIKAFLDNPQADFISFKILDLDGNNYKSYAKEKRWHTARTLTSIGTTEIAFKSKIYTEYNIAFDECFGPGAKWYPMGEDFIFVMDIYKKKIKMLFVPIPIVRHPKQSTGSSLDKKVIFARGAVFARVYGRLGYVLNIYFALKHKKMYQRKLSLISYLKLMMNGTYTYMRKRGCNE